LGNVIGSNIANLGLILGAAVLVSPPRIDAALRRRELPVLLASTFALPLVLLDGHVARWEGAALVACALAYTAWMVRSSRASVREVTADVLDTARAAEAASGGVAAAASPMVTSRLSQVAISALGLGTLLAGGHLFVTQATTLAMRWGMSERLVGLTIVAIGTSLPELVTSIIAARRGKSDLAVGNVVGSNIFNVLLCLGLASTSAPIESRAATFLVDLVALGLFTGAGLVFLRGARRMARAEGALLIAGYVAYLGYSATR
jgi:cation:H+ antiporter